MKKGKNHIIIAVALAAVIVCGSGDAFAADRGASAAGNAVGADAGMSTGAVGVVSAKEEVVYAKLAADGTAREAYIVNILSIARAGEVSDYGNYASVKNLTTADPVSQEAGGLVRTRAPGGDFYYQGNIERAELPWNIAIRYELNGKTVGPDALAGASGKLVIRIETRKNAALDPGWYDNLMMQISVTLDAALCKNIMVQDGMIANAGSNKLATFAVMPGKEGNLQLEADVVDFSMPGISFSAVPLHLGVERPDTAEMKEDMKKLSDGIGTLDNGAGELTDGAKKLADGAATYADGMTAFSDGLNTLSKNANKLKKGVRNMGDGLEDLARGLDALGQASDALPEQIAQGAGPTLAQQMGPAIAQRLSPALAQEIGLALAQNLAPTFGLDAETLSQTLTPTLTQALEPALSSALPEALSPALTEGFKQALGSALTDAPNAPNPYGSYGYQVKEAAKGAAALLDGFNNPDPDSGFASGLNLYLSGVKQASDGAGDLSGGAGDLRSGLSGFSNGIRNLKAGTLELRTETSDMPEKIEEKINEMIGEYDKSEYAPLSFASGENGKIGAIQFVITSEKIEKPDDVVITDSAEDSKSALDRFFELFR